MKKAGLEKNKGMKIQGKMKQFGTPGRFGSGAASVRTGANSASSTSLSAWCRSRSSSTAIWCNGFRRWRRNARSG